MLFSTGPHTQAGIMSSLRLQT